MDSLSHLDQRIAENQAAADRAGLPLREWDAPMLMRVWSRVTQNQEGERDGEGHTGENTDL